MRFLETYDQINESVGQGSIILIKGIGERKRLYAAHVKGLIQVKPGAKMALLSTDFYRIVVREGRLTALRVNFMSDEHLKNAINSKTPGRLSIVLNDKKTPYHWITGRHTAVFPALRAVEELIRQDDYILESSDTREERNAKFDELGNLIGNKLLNTLFFEKKELDIVSHRIEGQTIEQQTEDFYIQESNYFDLVINFNVIDRSAEVGSYLEYFDMPQPIECELTFKFYCEGHRETGDLYIAQDLEIEGLEFTLEGQTIKVSNELNDKLGSVAQRHMNTPEEKLLAAITAASEPPFYLQ